MSRWRVRAREASDHLSLIDRTLLVPHCLGSSWLAQRWAHHHQIGDSVPELQILSYALEGYLNQRVH